MKIIVSQQNKKILITFENKIPSPLNPPLIRGEKKRGSEVKLVDKFVVDKADDFLIGIDRFLKKRKIKVESLQKAGLKFVNIGLLTERIIRAIIAGISFDT